MQAFHVDTTCLSFVTAFRLAADMLPDPRSITSVVASEGRVLASAPPTGRP